MLVKGILVETNQLIGSKICILVHGLQLGSNTTALSDQIRSDLMLPVYLISNSAENGNLCLMVTETFVNYIGIFQNCGCLIVH